MAVTSSPIALALIAILLAGCGINAVKLRHPTTKEVATCGPYDLKFGIGNTEMRRCLDDFRRQGYERAPD